MSKLTKVSGDINYGVFHISNDVFMVLVFAGVGCIGTKLYQLTKDTYINSFDDGKCTYNQNKANPLVKWTAWATGIARRYEQQSKEKKRAAGAIADKVLEKFKESGFSQNNINANDNCASCGDGIDGRVNNKEGGQSIPLLSGKDQP